MQPAWREVRIEAAGSTPDAAVAELSGLYSGHDWAATTTDRAFTYRYSAVGDSDVTLRRAQLSGAVTGAVPPTDEYIVQWLTAGEGIPDVLQDRVPMVLDIPMLLPTAREFVFEYADHDQRLVHMSRRLVHEVADELFHTGPVSDLGINHLHPLDPAAVTRWRSSLHQLSRELRDGPSGGGDGDGDGRGGLVRSALSRAVVVAFLRMYPPHAVALPASVFLPRRERLRAAVEYIHEHITEPLRVADIAAAAGFSVRATQEAFQLSIGRSPLHYLQHVRLQRVRQDLQHADPDTSSVREVAQRWGFDHLGRFSAAYRVAFGEYPRTTLRR
ncbi:helix-turn-helix transcriptional regulator [Curtobacterium herbarum]|uniref:helix-turn-helix transcriptional regulator n=1 Tax=Curtobacterium herbarum TaxID=150122 RepID=UPI00195F1DDD|nr:AraC family transcriptional regulator [Curtobacterium herbarum]MBM7476963.1 AraC-like DNA-binding protein [Curtobacterium herbarum]MCS6545027.1 AraC family transcriptional regulator [Curtobacterium herbarum]